jgi:hypothetical protein
MSKGADTMLRWVWVGVLWTGIAVSGGRAAETKQETGQNSRPSYDRAVLDDHPVMFLNLGNVDHSSKFEPDQTGHGHQGKYLPEGAPLRSVRMPNGDSGVDFDGVRQYLEVASAPELSVPTTGILSIEVWMSLSTLQFRNQEGSGYVYWLGKGDRRQYEYAGRIYSLNNTEAPPRPNRISGYVFNLAGGLGAGSYFQDTARLHEWLHVVLVINTKQISPQFPTGYFLIYKNGVMRKRTALNQFNIVPSAGNAPLRVATMNLKSFFAGAIGKIALYEYALTPQQIEAHNRRMVGEK